VKRKNRAPDRYEVGWRITGSIYDLDCYMPKKAEAFAHAAKLAATIPGATGRVYDRYAHPRKPDGWNVYADGSAECICHRPEVA
jgi:hypothetical protein